MPYYLYIYILNMIYKDFLVNIFKWDLDHFLHTVKWFQILRSNLNNSISYEPFVAHNSMVSSNSKNLTSGLCLRWHAWIHMIYKRLVCE